jgi:hypothetical protein
MSERGWEIFGWLLVLLVIVVVGACVGVLLP